MYPTDDHNGSGTQPARGSMRVEVWNGFPSASSATISGQCTFYYKDPFTDKDEDPPETLDYSAARVPSGSALAFVSSPYRCVSAFRVDYSVKSPLGETPRFVERADVKNECWSFASFTCRP